MSDQSSLFLHSIGVIMCKLILVWVMSIHEVISYNQFSANSLIVLWGNIIKLFSSMSYDKTKIFIFCVISKNSNRENWNNNIKIEIFFAKIEIKNYLQVYLSKQYFMQWKICSKMLLKESFINRLAIQNLTQLK